MNQDQVSGTPPLLWKTHAWKKFTAGVDRPTPGGLVYDEVRIKRLCRQVEKLSWMVEYMDLCNRYDGAVDNTSVLVTLEEAEAEWQNR